LTSGREGNKKAPAPLNDQQHRGLIITYKIFELDTTGYAEKK
jgi:hypothetical protein